MEPPPGATSSEDEGRTVIPLTREPDGMQAWKIVIPTDKVTPEPRAHDGHEWIYVLSGHVRFVLGDEDRVLRPGDVASFERPSVDGSMARCGTVTPPSESPAGRPTSYRTVVADGLPELDERLSDELDRVNAAATAGVAPSRELTVQLLDGSGELAAGMSGWTWGVAAGIGLTWVREEARGDGLGARLLTSFEDEARARGCTHVFVTSFTFQAPGFYERHGYREIFRWEGVPTPDSADVHFRKDL